MRKFEQGHRENDRPEGNTAEYGGIWRRENEEYGGKWRNMVWGKRGIWRKMVGKIRNMEENGRENEEYAKFTKFLRYFMVCITAVI